MDGDLENSGARVIMAGSPCGHRDMSSIRWALWAQEQPELLWWEVEADESYFGGRRNGRPRRAAAGKVSVFGILQRHRCVGVTVVRDVSAKTVPQKTVKVVKRGSLVSTDKFGGDAALTYCGYRPSDGQPQHPV